MSDPTRKLIDAIHNNDVTMGEINDSSLVTACLLGHVQIVDLLCRHSSDCYTIDIQTQNNEPLILASQHGSVPMLTSLLSAKADLHARSGQSLIDAAARGHVDAVQLLLDKKADIHAQTNLALRLAIEHKDVAMTELLLKNGADPAALVFEALINDDLELTKFLLSLAPSSGVHKVVADTDRRRPRLLITKPNKTEKFIKSWSIYTRPDRSFSLEEVKRHIEEEGDRSLFTILSRHGMTTNPEENEKGRRRRKTSE